MRGPRALVALVVAAAVVGAVPTAARGSCEPTPTVVPGAAPPGADPLGAAPPDAAPPESLGPHPEGPHPVPGLVSEESAVAWSAGGTLGLIGIGAVAQGLKSSSEGNAVGPICFGAGYLVGPSLGHFYAKRPGRAIAGIAIRAAAVGMFVVGLGEAWNESGDSSTTLLALSILVGSGSFILDFTSARDSARKHNEEARRAYSPG